jgi:Right handed beta helix region
MWKYFFNGAVLLVLCAGKVHADARAINSNNSITFGARRAIPTQKFKKVIYAANYGVICDGITVNSTSVTNAIAAGGQNAHVIFPPGTCLISIESSTFYVYDGSWLQGAGRESTTLKRTNGGSNGAAIFSIAAGTVGGHNYGTTGNIMFSDMAIDGNQAGQSTATTTDIIEGLKPASGGAILRIRFTNSDRNAIYLPQYSTRNDNWLIADNEFIRNGLNATTCATLASCFDINIQSPFRVRILRNRSDGSFNVVGFSSSLHAGNVTISDNRIFNCTGFAVALGGGATNNAEVATISNNIIICPTAVNANLIDLALWQHILVAGNHIQMGISGGTGAPGIADGPPASNVTVVNNRIYGNAGTTASVHCIVLGGGNLVIKGNYCINAGGAGIAITPPLSTPAIRNILIQDNRISDVSQAHAGAHAGIDIVNTGNGIYNVAIKGNRIFDDQSTQTQEYGIAIALSGPTTSFQNFTIEGNDVRGNKRGGIYNNTSCATGFLIANNPGAEAFYVCQRTTCPLRTPSARAPKRQTPQP